MKKLVAALVCSTVFSFPAFADVAYVSNEKGGVSVIDLATLAIVQEFDVGGKTPRGIGVTTDGAYVLTANKDTDDVSVIDTKTGMVVRRIAVGEGPEFLRILGDFAYVTHEPGGRREEGKAEKPENDKEPAEISEIDLKTWKVTKSIKSGLETEGMEFSKDGKYVLATNEGDETVSVYERKSGEHVKTVSTRDKGKRPRGIKAMPDGKGYVVTQEGSNNFLVLDTHFNVTKSVPTKTGPYGIAFDPTGKYLLIAAARAGTLQLFDAKTFELVKEAELGMRCWHFTYTPDGTKILAACGRSNDLRVIDAKDFTAGPPIADGKMPWGVVTYPKGYGSLDTP